MGSLFAVHVEHFVVATVVHPIVRPILRTASPELKTGQLYAPNETGYLFEPHR